MSHKHKKNINDSQQNIFSKLSQCSFNAGSVQWLCWGVDTWRGKSLKCTWAAAPSAAFVVSCRDNSVTSPWWPACTTSASPGSEHREALRFAGARTPRHLPGARTSRRSRKSQRTVGTGCTPASSAHSYAPRPRPASSGQTLQRSRRLLSQTGRWLDLSCTASRSQRRTSSCKTRFLRTCSCRQRAGAPWGPARTWTWSSASGGSGSPRVSGRTETAGRCDGPSWCWRPRSPASRSAPSGPASSWSRPPWARSSRGSGACRWPGCAAAGSSSAGGSETTRCGACSSGCTWSWWCGSGSPGGSDVWTQIRNLRAF